jgi:hypothetical protein
MFAVANVADTLGTSKTALVESFSQAYNQVIALAPRVLAMLVVLVVGYIIARLVARVLTALSEKLGLQIAAERSGLAESMQHVGIKRNVPAIVGTIVFWLLMCVFAMAAFSILGLAALTAAMVLLVAYIPKLLVATILVVVGLLVAGFLRGVVATSADRLGVSYAEYLANGCYYALAVLTFIAAFDQLGIHYEMLNFAILIVFGGLALAFGLSFGLGGREVMAGILAGYYLRQRLNAGDHVQVAGLEGIVREVGPVATIVESNEDGLINRHTVPNTKMLNEAVR